MKPMYQPIEYLRPSDIPLIGRQTPVVTFMIFNNIAKRNKLKADRAERRRRIIDAVLHFPRTFAGWCVRKSTA